MRTLKFFAFIGILAVALTSCKKEEEEFTIVGKWNIDKYTATAFMPGTTTQILEVTETNKGWWQFNSGNTGVDDDGATFKWSLSGDNLSITFDNPSGVIFDSITFKLTTKTLKKVVGEATITNFEITHQGVEVVVDLKVIAEISKL